MLPMFVKLLLLLPPLVLSYLLWQIHIQILVLWLLRLSLAGTVLLAFLAFISSQGGI
jgi:hypothetical protein